MFLKLFEGSLYYFIKHSNFLFAFMILGCKRIGFATNANVFFNKMVDLQPVKIEYGYRPHHQIHIHLLESLSLDRTKHR